MKDQRYFVGITLIGFGIYYYLQFSDIKTFEYLHTWPMLFVIVGLGFLTQGYKGRVNDFILPGVVVTGFGLHFLLANQISIWPNELGVLILSIALGLLLQAMKKGSSKVLGMIVLFLAIFFIFYEKFTIFETTFMKMSSLLTHFWPILLVLVGIWALYRKK
ncbi:MAG: hypothetical protein K0R71_1835 [Bacillales bacterium]|jgi:hypothetical protein|nr:hypothetical protein [Bacillales bacterium]